MPLTEAELRSIVADCTCAVKPTLRRFNEVVDSWPPLLRKDRHVVVEGLDVLVCDAGGEVLARNHATCVGCVNLLKRCMEEVYGAPN